MHKLRSLICVLPLALVGLLFSAPTAAADTYNYAKWPEGTVCIVDKTSGTFRQAIHNTVERTKKYDLDSLKFKRLPTSNPTCSGYKNKIVIKQAYMGWTSNRAVLEWTGGFSGTDSNGWWLIKSPVTITFNTRYSSGSLKSAEWTAAHEIVGHSGGLNHRGSCSTAMRSGYSKYTSSCPAPRFLTADDRRYIRKLY